MINALFLILLCAAPLYADGPNFRNKDTFTQQEFENVYQDLKGKKDRTAIAFLAKCTSLPANITGDGTAYTIDYGSVTYDLGGNYSGANNIFTAPKAGPYSCSASLLTDGNTAGGGFTIGTLEIAINNGSTVYDQTWTNASGIGGVNLDRVPYMLSVPSMYLNVNDTVRVKLTVTGGAKTIDIISANQNWFGCALIN